MWCQPRIVALGAVLALLLGSRAVTARTWHIKPDGTGDAPTIQAGIDSAASGDSVVVDAGLYDENLDMRGKSIVLRGPLGPKVTVIDGGWRGRVLAMSGGVVEGFTFQRGFVDNYWVAGGAGILVQGPPGGAVIQNCVIQNNSCDTCGGAGILVVGPGPAVIRSCVIMNNVAGLSPEGGSGGGIALELVSGGAVIEDCTVRDNYAAEAGGGLSDWSGSTSTIVRGNTFIGNSTSHGGGAMVVGAATVEGNLVLDNETNSGGGGIHADGSANIRNNTVVRNRSWYGSAAGIWAFYGAVVSHNIVALNGPGVGVGFQGPVYPDCNDIWGNETDVIGWPGTGNGNFSSDPVFCGSAQGDYQLADFSPCLPANNSCAALIGALGAGCTISGAHEAGRLVSTLSISPNPLRSRGTITYSLAPDVRSARLMVYDLRGRVVSQLSRNAPLSRGAVTWDGRDAAGNAVSAGIYIVRLETGAGSVSRKIAWIR